MHGKKLLLVMCEHEVERILVRLAPFLNTAPFRWNAFCCRTDRWTHRISIKRANSSSLTLKWLHGFAVGTFVTNLGTATLSVVLLTSFLAETETVERSCENDHKNAEDATEDDRRNQTGRLVVHIAGIMVGRRCRR